jgi:cell division septum initiation protein DivIVA
MSRLQEIRRAIERARAQEEHLASLSNTTVDDVRRLGGVGALRVEQADWLLQRVEELEAANAQLQAERDEDRDPGAIAWDKAYAEGLDVILKWAEAVNYTEIAGLDSIDDAIVRDLRESYADAMWNSGEYS